MSVLRGQVIHVYVLNYFQSIFVFIVTATPPHFSFVTVTQGGLVQLLKYGEYQFQQPANRLPTSAEKRVWRTKQGRMVEAPICLSFFFFFFNFLGRETERQENVRVVQAHRPQFTKICVIVISKQTTISDLPNQIMVPDSGIMERLHRPRRDPVQEPVCRLYTVIQSTQANSFFNYYYYYLLGNPHTKTRDLS